jgi:CHAT domain-containing protein
LGLRANEKTVKDMKLDDVRVLAFATHGLVSGDLNGLDQPALALSAPDVAGVDGDGLLTMGEILTLKLNAEWVVLSACNTASADGQGAEAISGLGRAFFYAGARSLLVSNWPVHSGATAELTTTLFRIQTQDAVSNRAWALQQTRLAMIETGAQKNQAGDPLFSYAHPIFWAPFTIVGDGGG